MTIAPSSNGLNGRDSTGRFTKGNPGGPGSPYARRVSDLRRTLLEEVSDSDLRELVRTLVERGKRGDVMAAREVLDRLMGKAKVTMAVEIEPKMTLDEARARLRSLVERNPDLAEQLAGMMGAKMLPGGSTPQLGGVG